MLSLVSPYFLSCILLFLGSTVNGEGVLRIGIEEMRHLKPEMNKG